MVDMVVGLGSFVQVRAEIGKLGLTCACPLPLELDVAARLVRGAVCCVLRCAASLTMRVSFPYSSSLTTVDSLSAKRSVLRVLKVRRGKVLMRMVCWTLSGCGRGDDRGRDGD